MQKEKMKHCIICGENTHRGGKLCNHHYYLSKAFSPENHQWLLAFDNQSKGGRYVQTI